MYFPSCERGLASKKRARSINLRLAWESRQLLQAILLSKKLTAQLHR